MPSFREWFSEAVRHEAYQEQETPLEREARHVAASLDKLVLHARARGASEDEAILQARYTAGWSTWTRYASPALKEALARGEREGMAAGRSHG